MVVLATHRPRKTIRHTRCVIQKNEDKPSQRGQGVPMREATKEETHAGAT